MFKIYYKHSHIIADKYLMVSDLYIMFYMQDNLFLYF